MLFQSVWIEHLRCLEKIHFEPSADITVFFGDNGVGKSSLLEALYLLGRGQSFRPAQSRRLIQEEQDSCVVRAILHDASKQLRIPVAIQKTSQETRLRLAQEKSPKLSDLARYCPVLVLEPGQHRLLEDGPNLRRRYLDWSVFHVEPQYLLHWQRFSRALKQRNALLRRRQANQLSAWDEEFVQSAVKVDALRRQVFDQLHPLIEQLVREFFESDPQIAIDYRRGWNEKLELADALEQQRSLDLERGFTHAGPQRAEIRVRVKQHPAKDSLSRGQQKVLITAMMLAQAWHFEMHNASSPILLVDDLASELGGPARSRLFSWLQQYSGQVFITCLDETQLPDSLRETSLMFHVKHPGVLEKLSS